MTLVVYLIVFCLCAFQLSSASKGNPDPMMLKGKLARMRVMASTSAVKAKMYGLNKAILAPGMKRTLHIREALVKSAMDVRSFNSVNVLVRKANAGQWFLSKQLPLDEEQADLKGCILDGGKRAAVAQHILDKSIFSSLFGKGLGDPEFVLETRKREQEFATVKSADIEYGYQISSKFPVFSLSKFSPKPLLEKVPPLPQINIAALLNQLVKKKYSPEFPADLIQRMDQLIHVIDTTPNPTLLVTSDGSGELGTFDRRDDVCLAAGGAVILTPTSRKSTTSGAAHRTGSVTSTATNSIATQLQNSLFVRVNNLHHLTAAPLQAELVPGLVGLILVARLLDRYTQLQLQPPAQLRVQVQSESYTFLSDLRHCENQVDPREGKSSHERNMLSATLLAQTLYAEPSLCKEHVHQEEDNSIESEEDLDEKDVPEQQGGVTAAHDVPLSTYLATAPAGGDDQPSRYTNIVLLMFFVILHRYGVCRNHVSHTLVVRLILLHLSCFIRFTLTLSMLVLL